MTPRPTARTVPHDVWREDRADGSILLGSSLPLGPVAAHAGEWLHRWAAEAPGRTFVAERSGAGWRELPYAELLGQVRAVAAALAGRGLGPGRPVAVLSGPGVDHAVLSLAAQYAGVPVVPLAEQYSLVEAAWPRLVHAVEAVRPAMVFAAAGARHAGALALPCLEGVERVCSDASLAGATPFAALLRGDDPAALSAAHARVGPDTLAKILFTSGSTGSPKAVPTTQRMLCVNQAQMLAAMPFLRERAHRILDWLPWNHVFGGSHNFNLMLGNGGSLFLDDGRPTRAGFAATVRNTRERPGTLAFNVPVGFSMLLAAMRGDAALRRAYFGDLDLLFYAAAAVTRETWDELARLARGETGSVPLMYGAWGMTETAPASTQTHQRVERPGNIGVPLPGVTLKLLPDAEGRCELRVRGPNVMEGYLPAGEAAAASPFDAEGFLVTGDAVRFIDPGDPAAGLAFDGRVAEDFKLSTGTWVRATTLRLHVLGAMSALAADVVLCGHDRDELGLLVVPEGGAAAWPGARDVGGLLDAAPLREALRRAMAGLAEGAGSSTRIARAAVLAAAPSMADGELTAKGSINARQVLRGRAALVDRLYDDADPCVVRLHDADPPVAPPRDAAPPEVPR